MNKQQYQHAFVRAVTRSTSADTAAADLCAVARGVWYDSFTPDLSHLDPTSKRKAAYLLDFLTSTPALDQSRRVALRRLLQETAASLQGQQTSPHVTFYSGVPAPKVNRDALARKWHLASGMQPAKVKGLLDLQRRATQYQYEYA